LKGKSSEIVSQAAPSFQSLDYPSLVMASHRLQVKNRSTSLPQEANKACEIHSNFGMIGYDKARNNPRSKGS
jgi:hypothetical protein